MKEIVSDKEHFIEGLKTKTYNKIYEFTVKTKGEKTITNKDAFEFYKMLSNPQERGKYTRGFGKCSLRNLQKYLHEKGLI